MRVWAAAVLVILWTALPAAAAPEDVANRISSEIMSPFCPGVTLHDCPSREADALREEIRGWAADGWSDERIMDELVAQYGESVRAVPPSDGGGIGAWALPALVAVAGLVFAGTLARRWTRAREQDRQTEDVEARRALREADPEKRRQLAEELALHRARLLGDGPTETP